MNRQRNLLCYCAIFISLLLSACVAPSQNPVPAAAPHENPTTASLVVPTATTQPSETAAVVATATPTQTDTPQPTASPTPSTILKMKVTTYNILYGGGFDKRLPPEKRLDDRLKGILQWLSVESPDIIGLQELQGWELGTPTNMEQFAKELNMNSYLAVDGDSFHNGLLTKYEILEAKNLSPIIGPDGGLYARVKSPIGDIHVFVIHFEGQSPAHRYCQTYQILQMAEQHKNEPTLIMGDFNDFPDYIPYGWRNPVDFSKRSIDQIWYSPAINATFELSKTSPMNKYENNDLYDGKKLFELSDHLPITRIFNIQSIAPIVQDNQPQKATPTVPAKCE